ncbi:neuropeptide Y receptor type 2-like [Dreissena polymorpha]|uniref:neuropeptide Y receptor type 2-like n=1 Tax=Dreissena polymorpha TaxID=45954 RepID=UPI00226468F2|nr:neuropeptide Y receptor type 2-like [Dreissena polymorpha]
MENRTSFFNTTSVLETKHESNGLPLFAKITITLMIIVSIVVTVGNSLVIAAIVKFERLRDITGVFIANLAIADLIIGASLPFQIVFFFYPSLEANRVAYIMVGLIWTVDVIFQSIPLFGVNDYDQSPFCLYELVMDKWYRCANLVHGIVLAFIMFMLYMNIFLIVHKHVIKIQSEAIVQSESHQRQVSKQMNTSIAMVVLFFHISWLPFFLIQLTMLDVGQVTQIKVMVANFLVFLGIFNSVVNPFVYAWKNKEYRRAFRKLLGLSVRDEDSAVTTIA